MVNIAEAFQGIADFFSGEKARREAAEAEEAIANLEAQLAAQAARVEANLNATSGLAIDGKGTTLVRGVPVSESDLRAVERNVVELAGTTAGEFLAPHAAKTFLEDPIKHIEHVRGYEAAELRRGLK